MPHHVHIAYLRHLFFFFTSCCRLVAFLPYDATPMLSYRRRRRRDAVAAASGGPLMLIC